MQDAENDVLIPSVIVEGHVGLEAAVLGRRSGPRGVVQPRRVLDNLPHGSVDII